jgi:hypothetical protein
LPQVPMDGTKPFSLSISDLTNLGQDRAVEFFRRLLWAEAVRVGIGRHIIDVPDCINVGDGGIDAFLNEANPSIDDIIPIGTTGFQIKSSDLSPTACKNELHQNNKSSQPIKPEIKNILDKGGTYILVIFADISKTQRTKREQALRDELDRLGYNKFRLYTANQLVGFSERFPALVAWFKNEFSQCLPYSSWAKNRDVLIPQKFVADDERGKWIEKIREKLRDPKGDCCIFRVMGLSGIGKTRLVFEALSPDDLKNSVIYVKADQFRLSSLFNMIQNDQNLSAIIVIDECDLQQHDEFVRSFSGRGSRLAIFTVSYDIGKVPSPSVPLELNPLQRDRIEEMLKAEASKLPDEAVHRLSEFADGYPLIAILLAESYIAGKGSPEEFIGISDDALINRLIGGPTDTDTDKFKDTKRVLTGLSLFRKVGYEGALSKEAEWVAKMMEVPWRDFEEIVAEQKRRGIVHGNYYLYVRPFILRVHLLREWWEAHGFTKESFSQFLQSVPEEFRADLLQRFFDSIPYITTTERGREFAKEVLGESGVFSDGSTLKAKLGADFFLKLTEADPESALGCLRRTVGTWSKEQLLQFTIGRKEVVWSLEMIAMWRDLFPDAARLLLALAEAENETWSNNASGVFVQLFSPRLSSTEAAPQERFPILKEALESDSKERRLLALKACNQALESQHFARSVGAEYQGLRKEPKLWVPRTWGELFDTYRYVWQLLRDRLDSLQNEEQQKAVDILLTRARGLGRFQNLADMVITTVKEISGKPYVDKKKALAQVIQILRYEGKGLPAETRQRWEQLKETLTGSDFSSRLKRYAGMDLFEDKMVDEKGNVVDQTRPRIEELAKQAMEKNELLLPELSWLVTTEARNGYWFGYELGKKDETLSLLPILLEAFGRADKNASPYFHGGYFRAIYEKDREKWEKELDVLAEDKKLSYWVPELTWRSGMSDEAALRILGLAEKGVIGIEHFQMFGFGSVIKDLSEGVLKKWIEFLLGATNANAASIALDLYHFYYIGANLKRALPEELTLKLLIHPALFQKAEGERPHTMDEYNWTELGVAYVDAHKEKSLEIADKMLEHFGESGTIIGEFFSETQAVLNKIVQSYPERVWEEVIKYVGPPIDSRAFHIRQWLRGGEHYKEKDGALQLMPAESIWRWVDADVNTRACYLASFVPNVLFRKEGKVCLAREVLVRYGHRGDVRKSLMANFSTEGWSGPASLHYQEKKQQLLDFKRGEDNENVKRWIDEYVSALKWDIEQAKIDEERRGN